MADEKRPGEKIIIHHPLIREQIVRTRKQAVALADAGWREGPLPPKTAAKKTTTSASSGATGGE